MTTAIVTVNASVVQAPAPSNLQQVGALVTQGGTTGASGTATLVSGLADVIALLAPSKAVTNMVWSAGVVTVATTAAHGWTNGDVVPIKIAGVAPAGYNGTYTATITGASTFTYPLAANPGSVTVQGTATLGAVAQLRAMATTYFAGSGVPSVYVVELGEGIPSAGVAGLTTFMLNVAGSPQQVYAYMVPREWDNDSAFLAFLSNYTGVSAQVYFWVTTTLANRAVYSTPGYKCVYAEVEAPAIPATEFSLASAFGTSLKASPSSSAKLGPLTYSPSYGTTAYPLRGNQSVFDQLSTAAVGWIGTGQQGGVSGNIIYQGKMSDDNFWNFWYSVDWAEINMSRALANEVINGAASSVNPLYYNQDGINRLQNRVRRVALQGVTAGVGNGQVITTQLPVNDFLANYNAGAYNGQIVINAEPFLVYTAENPSDYSRGKYAGISCVWIPQLPFLNIFFNLQATTLITSG